MNAAPFDTLKMARKLETSGFVPLQAAGVAEAMAEAMSVSDLATKADIAQLGADVVRVEKDLGAELVRVEKDLGAELVRVEKDLGAELARVEKDLRTEITRVEKDLRADINRVEKDLRADINRVEKDLGTEIKGESLSLRHDIALLRRDMEVMGRDLTLRLGGMMIAGFGLVLGAMRYMLAHP